MACHWTSAASATAVTACSLLQVVASTSQRMPSLKLGGMPQNKDPSDRAIKKEKLDACLPRIDRVSNPCKQRRCSVACIGVAVWFAACLPTYMEGGVRAGQRTPRLAGLMTAWCCDSREHQLRYAHTCRRTCSVIISQCITTPFMPLCAKHQVQPGLYVSGAEAAKDPATLREHGITHVINCSAERYKGVKGVQYLCLHLQGRGAGGRNVPSWEGRWGYIISLGNRMVCGMV